MKKLLFIIFVIGVATLFFLMQTGKDAPHQQVTNFEECAATGAPVMESYPRQCRYGDKTFAEIITGGGGGILDLPKFDSRAEVRSAP